MIAAESQGTLAASCTQRIHGALLDDDGRPVPRGETDEIAIAGDTVGKGYWEDAKATENSFRNGAWLIGDIGFLDSQDHLHIIDRKKDVIISSGFNIYPREVEEVLYMILLALPTGVEPVFS